MSRRDGTERSRQTKRKWGQEKSLAHFDVASGEHTTSALWRKTVCFSIIFCMLFTDFIYTPLMSPQFNTTLAEEPEGYTTAVEELTESAVSLGASGSGIQIPEGYVNEVEALSGGAVETSGSAAETNVSGVTAFALNDGLELTTGSELGATAASDAPAARAASNGLTGAKGFPFGGGSGTQSDPFLIYTLDQLDQIRNYSTGTHYKQMADIHTYGKVSKSWKCIDHFNNSSYDGNNFSIIDIWVFGYDYMDSLKSNFGMFSTAQSSSFRNMIFINASMDLRYPVPREGPLCAGLIVGYAEDCEFSNIGMVVGYDSRISNQIGSTGIYSGSDISVKNKTLYTGSIAGYAKNSTIKNCLIGSKNTGNENDVSLNGFHIVYGSGVYDDYTYYAGGVVGFLEGGRISSCMLPGIIIVPSHYTVPEMISYIAGNVNEASVDSCYVGDSGLRVLTAMKPGTGTVWRWPEVELMQSGDPSMFPGISTDTWLIMEGSIPFIPDWLNSPAFETIIDVDVPSVVIEGLKHLREGSLSAMAGAEIGTARPVTGEIINLTLNDSRFRIANEGGKWKLRIGSEALKAGIYSFKVEGSCRLPNGQTIPVIRPVTVYVDAFCGCDASYFTSHTDELSFTVGDGTSDGTQAHPWIVENKYQLNHVRAHLSENFIQKANIDLSSFSSWNPIGDGHGGGASAFTGTYNGQNYRVSNLTINRNAGAANDELGLFGGVGNTEKETVIENLVLDQVKIAVTGSKYIPTGAIAGSAGSGNVTIKNCAVLSGSVSTASGSFRVAGGIVGDMYSSGTIRVENCFNGADISSGGSNQGGGIAGRSIGSANVIENCVSTGKVTSGYGLIGNNPTIGTVTGYYVKDLAADNSWGTALEPHRMYSGDGGVFSALSGYTMEYGFAPYLPQWRNGEKNNGALMESLLPREISALPRGLSPLTPGNTADDQVKGDFLLPSKFAGYRIEYIHNIPNANNGVTPLVVPSTNFSGSAPVLGKVTRPWPGDGDRSGTLTVQYHKSGASGSRSYPLTIKEDVPTPTTIVLDCAGKTIQITPGETKTLTVTADVKDQYGQSMSRQDVVWRVENASGQTALTGITITRDGNNKHKAVLSVKPSATAQTIQVKASVLNLEASVIIKAESVNVTPGKPDVPQNLKAVSGNLENILSWTAPSTLGGVPLSKYVIYRSDSQNGTYTKLAETGSGTLSYIHTNLAGGSTHWYRVTAVNTSGFESAYAGPVSASAKYMCGHTAEYFASHPGEETFDSGAGTEASPYTVSTAKQLSHVRGHLAEHFVQTADIDLSGYSNWEPIGTTTDRLNRAVQFTGVYDGADHLIDNLNISRTGLTNELVFYSLFGHATDATFRSMVLDHVNVSVEGSRQVFAGAIASELYGNSLVENCAVLSGTVYGRSTGNTWTLVGGVVASMEDGASQLRNCYSGANVNAVSGANSYAGGISNARSTSIGKAEDCISTGRVTASQNAGGILGRSGQVTNSYYSSDKTAEKGSRGSGAAGLSVLQMYGGSWGNGGGSAPAGWSCQKYFAPYVTEWSRNGANDKLLSARLIAPQISIFNSANPADSSVAADFSLPLSFRGEGSSTLPLSWTVSGFPNGDLSVSGETAAVVRQAKEKGDGTGTLKVLAQGTEISSYPITVKALDYNLIVLKGVTQLVIPTSGSAPLVNQIEAYGKVVDSDAGTYLDPKSGTWSVADEGGKPIAKGVTVGTDGRLTVTSEAPGGNAVVSFRWGSITAKHTVNLRSATAPQDLSLSAESARIAVPGVEETDNVYDLTANLTDSYGTSMKDQTLVWSLVEGSKPAGVTITERAAAGHSKGNQLMQITVAPTAITAVDNAGGSLSFTIEAKTPDSYRTARAKVTIYRETARLGYVSIGNNPLGVNLPKAAIVNDAEWNGTEAEWAPGKVTALDQYKQPYTEKTPGVWTLTENPDPDHITINQGTGKVTVKSGADFGSANETVRLTVRYTAGEKSPAQKEIQNETRASFVQEGKKPQFIDVKGIGWAADGTDQGEGYETTLSAISVPVLLEAGQTHVERKFRADLYDQYGTDLTGGAVDWSTAGVAWIADGTGKAEFSIGTDPRNAILKIYNSAGSSGVTETVTVSAKVKGKSGDGSSNVTANGKDLQDRAAFNVTRDLSLTAKLELTEDPALPGEPRELDVPISALSESAVKVKLTPVLTDQFGKDISGEKPVLWSIKTSDPTSLGIALLTRGAVSGGVTPPGTEEVPTEGAILTVDETALGGYVTLTAVVAAADSYTGEALEKTVVYQLNRSSQTIEAVTVGAVRLVVPEGTGNNHAVVSRVTGAALLSAVDQEEKPYAEAIGGQWALGADNPDPDHISIDPATGLIEVKGDVRLDHDLSVTQKAVTVKFTVNDRNASLAVRGQTFEGLLTIEKDQAKPVSMSIDPNSASIPVPSLGGQPTRKEFTAVLPDQFGGKLLRHDAAVQWSLNKEYQGITLGVVDGQSGVVTVNVTDRAQIEDGIRLTAFLPGKTSEGAFITYNGEDLKWTITFDVTKDPLYGDSMYLTPGAASIVSGGSITVPVPYMGETTEVAIDAIVKDQYGNPITDKDIVWTVEGNLSGMSYKGVPSSGHTAGQQTLKLTLDHTVRTDLVTVHAIYLGINGRKFEDAIPVRITIEERRPVNVEWAEGPEKLGIPNAGVTRGNYTVEIQDQYGDSMNSWPNIFWSKNNPDNTGLTFTVDEETNRSMYVEVSPQTIEQELTITVRTLNEKDEVIARLERTVKIAAGAASAPKDAAVSGGARRNDISFKAPDFPGGTPIAYYTVYREPAPEGGSSLITTLPAVSAAGHVYSCTDYLVDGGQDYVYTVAAVNEAGVEGVRTEELQARPTWYCGCASLAEGEEDFARPFTENADGSRDYSIAYNADKTPTLNGTDDSHAWHVESMGQLSHVRSHLHSHFLQTRDIDAAAEGVTNFRTICPTNAVADYATLVYDGGNHVLKNVRIYANGSNTSENRIVGLFGGFNGTLRNLVVDSMSMESTYYSTWYAHVGLIAHGDKAGTLVENVAILNSSIRGINPNGPVMVGAFGSYSQGTTFKNCLVDANTTVSSYAKTGERAGAAGFSYNGNTVNCISLAKLTVENGSAQITPFRLELGTVTNCFYDSTTVTPTTSVSGQTGISTEKMHSGMWGGGSSAPTGWTCTKWYAPYVTAWSNGGVNDALLTQRLMSPQISVVAPVDPARTNVKDSAVAHGFYVPENGLGTVGKITWTSGEAGLVSVSGNAVSINNLSNIGRDTLTVVIDETSAGGVVSRTYGLGTAAVCGCTEMHEGEDFFTKGAGTTASPYEVASARQLNHVRRHLGASYVQTADIDMAAEGFTNFTPIGDRADGTEVFDGTGFTGTYDGGNHLIDNLTIHINDGVRRKGFGLFARISGNAAIRNVIIDHADLSVVNTSTNTNTGNWAGILVGLVEVVNSTGNKGNMVIENCAVLSGSLYNYTYRSNDVSFTAGIVGYNTANLTLKNCYNGASVTSRIDTESKSHTAGILGASRNTTCVLSNCVNTGLVKGQVFASQRSGVSGIASNYENNVPSTNSYFLNTSVFQEGYYTSAPISKTAAQLTDGTGSGFSLSGWTFEKGYYPYFANWSNEGANDRLLSARFMTDDLSANTDNASMNQITTGFALTVDGVGGTGGGLAGKVSWKSSFDPAVLSIGNDGAVEIGQVDRNVKGRLSADVDGVKGKEYELIVVPKDLVVYPCGCTAEYFEAHPGEECFAGGAGTTESAFEIANARQLSHLRNHLTASAIQTADIDLTDWQATYGGGNWDPIGGGSISQMPPVGFAGHFDGGNHLVSGLEINKTGLTIEYNLYGLFGALMVDAEIVNVILDSPVISVAGTNRCYAGALVGYMDSNVKISRCAVWNGSISSLASTSGYWVAAGGIVGYSRGTGAEISGCYVSGSVTTSTTELYHRAGGIVGLIKKERSVAIESCIVNSKLAGTRTDSMGTAENSTAQLTVSDCYYDSTLLTPTTVQGTGLPADKMYGGETARASFGTAEGTIGAADSGWVFRENYAPSLKQWENGGANLEAMSIGTLAWSGISTLSGDNSSDQSVVHDFAIPMISLTGDDYTWLPGDALVRKMIVHLEEGRIEVTGAADASGLLTVFYMGGAIRNYSMSTKGTCCTVTIGTDEERFTKGSGTEADPYIVENAAQLNHVRRHLKASFRQVADIDLSGYSNWTPIGDGHGGGASAFAGHYDGQNHLIDNLKINGSSGSANDEFGLFGGVGTSGYNTVIENVLLNNVNVVSTGTAYTPTAALAGSVGSSTVLIRNCAVLSGSVTCNNTTDFGPAAGIVGDMHISGNITVEDCYSGVTTKCGHASGGAGGIAGRLVKGTIKNCLATGQHTNTANSSVRGGIVGIYVGGTVTGTYYDGDRQPSSTNYGTKISTNQMCGGDPAQMPELAEAGFVRNKHYIPYLSQWLSGTRLNAEGETEPYDNSLLLTKNLLPADITKVANGTNALSSVKHNFSLPANGLGSVGKLSWTTSNDYLAVGKASGEEIPVTTNKYAIGMVNLTANTGESTEQAAAGSLVKTYGLTTVFRCGCTAIVEGEEVFEEGSGTADDPYQVANERQLNHVRRHLDKHYVQTADIDLAGYTNWEPIGIGSNLTSSDIPLMFSGSYDGADFIIRNLTVRATNTAPENLGAGLFGGLYGNAVLKNVILDQVDVSAISSSSHPQVGALAGDIYTTATGQNIIIKDCAVLSGKVYGQGGHGAGWTMVGGIVGDGYDGRLLIENCFNNARVQSYGNMNNTNEKVGGIVSRVSSTTNQQVKGCINTGTVTARYSAAVIRGIGPGNYSGNFYLNTCFGTGTTGADGTALSPTQLYGGTWGGGASEVPAGFTCQKSFAPYVSAWSNGGANDALLASRLLAPEISVFADGNTADSNVLKSFTVPETFKGNGPEPLALNWDDSAFGTSLMYNPGAEAGTHNVTVKQKESTVSGSFLALAGKNQLKVYPITIPGGGTAFVADVKLSDCRIELPYASAPEAEAVWHDEYVEIIGYDQFGEEIPQGRMPQLLAPSVSLTLNGGSLDTGKLTAVYEYRNGVNYVHIRVRNDYPLDYGWELPVTLKYTGTQQALPTNGVLSVNDAVTAAAGSIESEAGVTLFKDVRKAAFMETIMEETTPSGMYILEVPGEGQPANRYTFHTKVWDQYGLPYTTMKSGPDVGKLLWTFDSKGASGISAVSDVGDPYTFYLDVSNTADSVSGMEMTASVAGSITTSGGISGSAIETQTNGTATGKTVKSGVYVATSRVEATAQRLEFENTVGYVPLKGSSYTHLNLLIYDEYGKEMKNQNVEWEVLHVTEGGISKGAVMPYYVSGFRTVSEGHREGRQSYRFDIGTDATESAILMGVTLRRPDNMPDLTGAGVFIITRHQPYIDRLEVTPYNQSISFLENGAKTTQTKQFAVTAWDQYGQKVKITTQGAWSLENASGSAVSMEGISLDENGLLSVDSTIDLHANTAFKACYTADPEYTNPEEPDTVVTHGVDFWINKKASQVRNMDLSPKGEVIVSKKYQEASREFALSLTDQYGDKAMTYPADTEAIAYVVEGSGQATVSVGEDILRPTVTVPLKAYEENDIRLIATAKAGYTYEGEPVNGLPMSVEAMFSIAPESLLARRLVINGNNQLITAGGHLTEQYRAIAYDKYGDVMDEDIPVTWSAVFASPEAITMSGDDRTGRVDIDIAEGVAGTLTLSAVTLGEVETGEILIHEDGTTEAAVTLGAVKADFEVELLKADPGTSTIGAIALEAVTPLLQGTENAAALAQIGTLSAIGSAIPDVPGTPQRFVYRVEPYTAGVTGPAFYVSGSGLYAGENLKKGDWPLIITATDNFGTQKTQSFEITVEVRPGQIRLYPAVQRFDTYVAALEGSQKLGFSAVVAAPDDTVLPQEKVKFAMDPMFTTNEAIWMVQGGEPAVVEGVSGWMVPPPGVTVDSASGMVTVTSEASIADYTVRAISETDETVSGTAIAQVTTQIYAVLTASVKDNRISVPLEGKKDSLTIVASVYDQDGSLLLSQPVDWKPVAAKQGDEILQSGIWPKGVSFESGPADGHRGGAQKGVLTLDSSAQEGYVTIRATLLNGRSTDITINIGRYASELTKIAVTGQAIEVPWAQPDQVVTTSAALTLIGYDQYGQVMKSTAAAVWTFGPGGNPDPAHIAIDPSTGAIAVSSEAEVPLSGAELGVQASVTLSGGAVITAMQQIPVYKEEGKAQYIRITPPALTVEVDRKETIQASFGAIVYTQYGKQIEAASLPGITWAVEGTDQAEIKVAGDGSGVGVVSIPRSVLADQVTISAIIAGADTADGFVKAAEATLIIEREPSYASGVEILGSGNAVIPTTGAVELSYLAQIVDQYGQPMTGQAIQWSVTGASITGVSVGDGSGGGSAGTSLAVGGQRGTVTVDASASPGAILLEGRLIKDGVPSTDLFGERTITLVASEYEANPQITVEFVQTEEMLRQGEDRLKSGETLGYVTATNGALYATDYYYYLTETSATTTETLVDGSTQTVSRSRDNGRFILRRGSDNRGYLVIGEEKLMAGRYFLTALAMDKTGLRSSEVYIEIYVDRGITYVTVSPARADVVRKAVSQEVRFTAEVRDYNGKLLANEPVEWKLSKKYAGVSVNTGGAVSVRSDTVPGSVELIASAVNRPDVTGGAILTITEAPVDQLTVKGSNAKQVNRSSEAALTVTNGSGVTWSAVRITGARMEAKGRGPSLVPVSTYVSGPAVSGSAVSGPAARAAVWEYGSGKAMTDFAAEVEVPAGDGSSGNSGSRILDLSTVTGTSAASFGGISVGPGENLELNARMYNANGLSAKENYQLIFTLELAGTDGSVSTREVVQPMVTEPANLTAILNLATRKVLVRDTYGSYVMREPNGMIETPLMNLSGYPLEFKANTLVKNVKASPAGIETKLLAPEGFEANGTPKVADRMLAVGLSRGKTCEADCFERYDETSGTPQGAKTVWLHQALSSGETGEWVSLGTAGSGGWLGLGARGHAGVGLFKSSYGFAGLSFDVEVVVERSEGNAAAATPHDISADEDFWNAFPDYSKTLEKVLSLFAGQE